MSAQRTQFAKAATLEWQLGLMHWRLILEIEMDVNDKYISIAFCSTRSGLSDSCNMSS